LSRSSTTSAYVEPPTSGDRRQQHEGILEARDAGCERMGQALKRWTTGSRRRPLHRRQARHPPRHRPALPHSPHADRCRQAPPRRAVGRRQEGVGGCRY
jgi:hypothetical protein